MIETELPRWDVLATVDKWFSAEDHECGFDPDETVELAGNGLLIEGVTELFTLLIAGGGTTAFSNANARLGVGNGTAAFVNSQTGLQGGSSLYLPMDATYPQVASNVITFRSTFGANDANFAWEEWSIDNGSTPNKNLNRKVGSLGTKVVSTIWTLTVTITLS